MSIGAVGHGVDGAPPAATRDPTVTAGPAATGEPAVTRDERIDAVLRQLDAAAAGPPEGQLAAYTEAQQVLAERLSEP